MNVLKVVLGWVVKTITPVTVTHNGLSKYCIFDNKILAIKGEIAMCEVYWYMVILLLVLIGQKAMVMIKLVTHRKSI